MKKLVLALILMSVIGCARAYPKLFDNPKFQEKCIELMDRSLKNVAASADVSNPEFEAGIKQSVYMRLIGISGHLQGSGSDKGE